MKDTIKYIGIVLLIVLTMGWLVYMDITEPAPQEEEPPGFDYGYEVGYADGIEEAQSFLAFIIEDDLSMLGWEIEETYGVHPEDALLILSNYADVPDEVTEEELHAAIWAIYRYYYKSHEVIDGIEDYWID